MWSRENWEEKIRAMSQEKLERNLRTVRLGLFSYKKGSGTKNPLL